MARPLCRRYGPAAAAVLHHRRDRQYDPGSVYLSLCQKDPGLGRRQEIYRKIFHMVSGQGERGGQKLQQKAGRGLFLALLLFVGIPLPGTGAWTGTLAASFLDMDFKPTVFAAMGGVLLAGVIMGAASAGLFSALAALF